VIANQFSIPSCKDAGFSLNFSFLASLLSVASFYFWFAKKQHLQTGLYISSPPINSISLLSTTLFVNAAYLVQYTHTAFSLVTFSAFGIKLMIFPKGFLSKVPSSAAIMTILFLFAII
jgi:hypothetical protein